MDSQTHIPAAAAAGILHMMDKARPEGLAGGDSPHRGSLQGLGVHHRGAGHAVQGTADTGWHPLGDIHRKRE